MDNIIRHDDDGNPVRLAPADWSDRDERWWWAVTAQETEAASAMAALLTGELYKADRQVYAAIAQAVTALRKVTDGIDVRLGSRADRIRLLEETDRADREAAAAADPGPVLGSIVLDSEGGLWCCCRPDHDGAQAFGPVGAARPVTIGRPGLAPTGHGPTAEERGYGTVDYAGEWPVFVPYHGTEVRP